MYANPLSGLISVIAARFQNRANLDDRARYVTEDAEPNNMKHRLETIRSAEVFNFQANSQNPVNSASGSCFTATGRQSSAVGRRKLRYMLHTVQQNKQRRKFRTTNERALNHGARHLAVNAAPVFCVSAVAQVHTLTRSFSN
jgi:predicted GTPase